MLCNCKIPLEIIHRPTSLSQATFCFSLVCSSKALLIWEKGSWKVCPDAWMKYLTTLSGPNRFSACTQILPSSSPNPLRWLIFFTIHSLCWWSLPLQHWQTDCLLLATQHNFWFWFRLQDVWKATCCFSSQVNVAGNLQYYTQIGTRGLAPAFRWVRTDLGLKSIQDVKLRSTR